MTLAPSSLAGASSLVSCIEDPNGISVDLVGAKADLLRGDTADIFGDNTPACSVATVADDAARILHTKQHVVQKRITQANTPMLIAIPKELFR